MPVSEGARYRRFPYAGRPVQVYEPCHPRQATVDRPELPWSSGYGSEERGASARSSRRAAVRTSTPALNGPPSDSSHATSVRSSMESGWRLGTRAAKSPACARARLPFPLTSAHAAAGAQWVRGHGARTPRLGTLAWSAVVVAGGASQTAVVVRYAELARRLWSRLEPIHVVTYFSPEARAALSGAGYKGFWMGYFAGRAAPMGPVGPEVVFATFYNFSIAHVSRAIPDAWTFAPPGAALEARERGSAAALRRAFARRDLAEAVETAAVLARAAAESAPMEGRALFAANRALPWPTEPAAVLWQACTLLREHRGDGHVAALAAAGIGGREANVLQTAAGVAPRDVFEAARHYDDAEWDRVSARLIDRGLVGPDGKLTARGKDVRNDVEDRTDRVALTAYDRLDDEQLLQLLDALAPLARAVIATGDIPEVTPIGQRFEL